MRLTTLLSMAARVVIPKDYRFGTNRPWTPAAKRLNPPGKKRRKVFVEPIAPEDWPVFRGDTVSNIPHRKSTVLGTFVTQHYVNMTTCETCTILNNKVQLTRISERNRVFFRILNTICVFVSHTRGIVHL